MTWHSLNFDRQLWSRVADYLAIVVVITIPWSSSATSIAILFWLPAALATIDVVSLRKIASTAAGGAPIILALLGLLGTLWADVSLADRWNGLIPFLRFLAIPILLTQFSLSSRSHLAAIGFLTSTAILALISFSLAIFDVQMPGKGFGIVVKDYIAQSSEFTLAAFGCFYLALRYFRDLQRTKASALAVGGALFLANILLVTASRTSLIALPVMVALFVTKTLRGAARALVVTAGICVVIAAILFAPVASERLLSLKDEIQQYRAENRVTSAGERLEYWAKAVTIIHASPFLGHGTGSIKETYRSLAKGDGITAQIPDNPHNQFFAIGIQVGLLGMLVLMAMWIAHLFLFSANAAAGFVGAFVVIQNIVGSLFNSHLFDFTHSWLYIFGVGIAGGAIIRERWNS